MRVLKASAIHPYSWWILGLCFAISAAATTHILALLAISGVVVSITISAREPAPWSKSLVFYLVTALAVVAIRLIFRIIFNFDSGLNAPTGPWTLAGEPLAQFRRQLRDESSVLAKES